MSIKYELKIVYISEIREGERIRQNLGDIESLSKSISELGLMYPILITSNYDLVDGGRRLAAVRLLGWTKVSVIIMSTEILESETYEQ